VKATYQFTKFLGDFGKVKTVLEPDPVPKARGPDPYLVHTKSFGFLRGYAIL
jgi:hypothetical protein